MTLAPFLLPGKCRVAAVFLLSLPVWWGALFVAQTARGQSPDPYPPTRIPDRIILTWNGDPATTQAVTWRTDTTVTEAVAEIALADGTPAFPVNAKTVNASTEKLKTNKNVAHFHSAVFSGLKPNTLYGYRVGDGKTWSEWFHFRTGNDKPAPFSFLYFGDAQNDIKSLWSRCVRQAYSTMPDVDFLLHAGDLVNIPARDEEWGEWFYAAGWINGMKSNVLTPGNHEYTRTSSGERGLEAHWRPSFTLHENGPKGLEETVYYFDYQGVRFISLNTQAMLNDSTSIDIQKNWLENLLKDNPNRWTIITHHHPIYSTAMGRDNADIRDALQPLYEKYHVDLVLQGHDHTYGRGYNLAYGNSHFDKGPIYVVSVSGPKMYNLNFDEWLERVASNTQLYQLISLDGKNLEYKAYTATGQLYDGFRLIKSKKGTNKFYDEAPKDVPENTNLPESMIKLMSDKEINLYKQRLQKYLDRKALRGN